MMNATVTITSPNRCFPSVNSNRLSPEKPVGASIPYFLELFFVDITERFIASAAREYRSISFYQNRKPSIVTRNHSIEFPGIEFFSKNLQEIFDILVNFTCMKVVFYLNELFSNTCSLRLCRNQYCEVWIVKIIHRAKNDPVCPNKIGKFCEYHNTVIIIGSYDIVKI